MSTLKINYLMYRMIREDGYGRFGMQQIKGLVHEGIDVYPDHVSTLEAPGWIQRLRGLDTSKLTIALMPPHDLPGMPGRIWNYTMYESTGIPDGWADHVNQKAERLLVPCEWLVEVFREAGVRKRTVPIDVVHGGVDVDEFPLIDAPVPDHRPYTFLAFGDRGSRKGMDIAWQAFYKAFEDSKDVRFVIKSRPMNLKDLCGAHGDRRVSLWREDVDSLSHVFAQIDCFVFPTKGEGWGLPPRECACMGKPVITTRFGGTAVGIDNWAIPIENYTMQPARIRGGGDWAKADVDEVAHHMRWCFDNREEARQKAVEGAHWLRENQSWRHSARQLIDLMEMWD